MIRHDDSSTTRRRARRQMDVQVGRRPDDVSDDLPSTLSATTLDGGGQHSGRSRMARALGRAAARAQDAVTRPAVPVEDLIEPCYVAGDPPMLHVHLYSRAAGLRALALHADHATLVVAAVPQLVVGETVLAVLQLSDGTFQQLPAIVVRRGPYRVQLALAELSVGTLAHLAAALR